MEPLAPCELCQAPLAPGWGALQEDVCTGCGARHLPDPAAEQLRTRYLHITVEMLRELVTQLGGGAHACHGCGQKMQRVPLRGQNVEVCLACGAMFLRAGQLKALTAGEVVEVQPPAVEPIPLPEPPPPAWWRLALWFPATVGTALAMVALAHATVAPLQMALTFSVPPGAALNSLAWVPAAVMYFFLCPVGLWVGTATPENHRSLLGWASGVVTGCLALAGAGQWVFQYGWPGLVPLTGALLGLAWAWRLQAVWTHDAQSLQQAGKRLLTAALACVVMLMAGVWGGLSLTHGHCPAGTHLQRVEQDGMAMDACVDSLGLWTGPARILDDGGGVSAKGHFVESKATGLWKSYHRNGSPQDEVNWSNGLRQGAFKAFHPNGKVLAAGAFDQDRQHGPWITFYPTGAAESEGEWTHGKRRGRWTFWDAQGNITRQEKY